MDIIFIGLRFNVSKKPWLPLFLIVPGGRSLLARTLARPVDQEEDDGPEQCSQDGLSEGRDMEEEHGFASHTAPHVGPGAYLEHEVRTEHARQNGVDSEGADSP